MFLHTGRALYLVVALSGHYQESADISGMKEPLLLLFNWIGELHQRALLLMICVCKLYFQVQFIIVLAFLIMSMELSWFSWDLLQQQFTELFKIVKRSRLSCVGGRCLHIAPQNGLWRGWLAHWLRSYQRVWQLLLSAQVYWILNCWPHVLVPQLPCIHLLNLGMLLPA